MGGLMSRNKGKRWERACATKLREVFNLGPEEVRRGWQARDGADAPDVLGVPRFWVETKNEKLVGLRAALRQAEEASAGKGLVPLVLAKDNNGEPMALLRMEPFLELVKEWWEGKQALAQVGEKLRSATEPVTAGAIPSCGPDCPCRRDPAEAAKRGTLTAQQLQEAMRGLVESIGQLFTEAKRWDSDVRTEVVPRCDFTCPCHNNDPHDCPWEGPSAQETK